MICSRCGQTNTEFSTYWVLKKVKDIQLAQCGWKARCIGKLFKLFKEVEIITEVDICQSCTSKMFRKLDKDV